MNMFSPSYPYVFELSSSVDAETRCLNTVDTSSNCCSFSMMEVVAPYRLFVNILRFFRPNSIPYAPADSFKLAGENLQFAFSKKQSISSVK